MVSPDSEPVPLPGRSRTGSTCEPHFDSVLRRSARIWSTATATRGAAPASRGSPACAVIVTPLGGVFGCYVLRNVWDRAVPPGLG